MARVVKADKTLYSGYLLAFEPKRTEKIESSLYSAQEASESFSAMDWTFERREIALLALNPGEHEISALVLMERMHGSGGTGKLKMRMYAPLLLEKPISAAELALAVVFDVGERISSAERLKRIPVPEWSLLLNAIKKLRPNIAELLDAMVLRRDEARRIVGESVRLLRLMEQRDAIGLALDMASLDRQTVMREANYEKVDSAMSALDLLDHEPLQEQDLIRLDQQTFANLLTSDMRAARFTGPGGREVRVYIYDKKPLETVLGIDLLIYQESYKSFLLLQYKNMEQIPAKRGQTWSYLVDDQIHVQMGAMETGLAAMQKQAAIPQGLNDWRLHNGPFYFKFCETTRPNARDDALVGGITLGLDHLKHFLTLPDAAGQHGGLRVGYDNCPRYLNNTQFVDLARDGWIGCDQKGYQLITEVLAAGRVGGKRAMFAVIRGSGATTASDRRKWKK
jgi:hypothetical protein